MAAPGAWQPTIGVPFQAMQLTSADGATLTATITVLDGAGRFATTLNNTSPRSVRIRYYDPEPGEFNVPPGETVFAGSGTRRWPYQMSFGSP